MAKDQNTSSTDKVALKQPGSVTANSFLSELSPPTKQPGQREGSHGLVTKQNTYDAFWASQGHSYWEKAKPTTQFPFPSHSAAQGGKVRGR